ncbi:MAG: hypothetical protein LBR54_01715 [Oscillospiraceae bacterium]|nr:hypothetical protein [Oscillospiraceae bacterium]
MRLIPALTDCAVDLGQAAFPCLRRRVPCVRPHKKRALRQIRNCKIITSTNLPRDFRLHTGQKSGLADEGKKFLRSIAVSNGYGLGFAGIRTQMRGSVRTSLSPFRVKITV